MPLVADGRISSSDWGNSQIQWPHSQVGASSSGWRKTLPLQPPLLHPSATLRPLWGWKYCSGVRGAKPLPATILFLLRRNSEQGQPWHPSYWEGVVGAVLLPPIEVGWTCDLSECSRSDTGWLSSIGQKRRCYFYLVCQITCTGALNHRLNSPTTPRLSCYKPKWPHWEASWRSLETTWWEKQAQPAPRCSSPLLIQLQLQSTCNHERVQARTTQSILQNSWPTEIMRDNKMIVVILSY